MYEVADVHAPVFTPGNVVAEGVGLDLMTQSVAGTDKVLQLDVAPGLILQPRDGSAGYAISITSEANEFLPYGYWTERQGNPYSGGTAYFQGPESYDFSLALTGTIQAPPVTTVPLPPSGVASAVMLGVLWGVGATMASRRLKD